MTEKSSVDLKITLNREEVHIPLDALCGQLTFRLAWWCEHSAVMATELCSRGTSPCGTLFQSSCVILTSSMDYSDDSWRDTFFGKHEHGALWRLICDAIAKTLTYLLTYIQSPERTGCRNMLTLRAVAHKTPRSHTVKMWLLHVLWRFNMRELARAMLRWSR